jgi:Tol biopolymer transport system component
VGALVARLRESPARSPAFEKERFGLFLLDIERGDVTQVADEPIRGLYYCSSPSWSKEGRRLVFDASLGAIFNRTQIEMITTLGRKDLGPGACPSLSPDGERIAFLLNPGAVAGAEAGVWVMRADGTDRRRLGGYGRPKWSPDGRKILVSDFSNPCRVSLLDESGALRPIEGLSVDSVPDWAGKDTIVAAVNFDAVGDTADMIALVDISDPRRSRLKEALWRKGDGLDLSPSYPVYSPDARLCVFVGSGPQGMALYRLDRDSAGPRRLEPGRSDRTIQDLALSPDGRYVLFTSDRAARPLHPAPGEAPEPRSSRPVGP